VPIRRNRAFPPLHTRRLRPCRQTPEHRLGLQQVLAKCQLPVPRLSCCNTERRPKKVRILFGPSPTAPYNDSNLYNLYCKAFKEAGFASKIKVHLPRHLIGYSQERLGLVPAFGCVIWAYRVTPGSQKRTPKSLDGVVAHTRRRTLRHSQRR
jgi:hypothetical protein